ncbi:uncharacterized protein DUF1127 [Aliiruegeria haliotis]|uniref:Uncharacterized protein DUF1127 n=1 Tax=Aliiruegeria haliotis TaxID=1280846 RepID=A0A2T0RXR8_9RHOB|nr:DUF1127 domain-containing protein [Aliiruegeria haliotis]PRY25986.1 uncharacterized protein DUF1127 [Aliiruegeria haliotis]
MDTTLNTAAGSINWTKAPLETLKLKYEQYKVYRTTVTELSQLSDRALADLGVSRSMIRSLARDAAYGA